MSRGGCQIMNATHSLKLKLLCSYENNDSLHHFLSTLHLVFDGCVWCVVHTNQKENIFIVDKETHIGPNDDSEFVPSFSIYDSDPAVTYSSINPSPRFLFPNSGSSNPSRQRKDDRIALRST
mmetsp:Transcript_20786/g.33778  ORF Transcript_20786/g.33778 Transcript_20786/m.33778 type:complete len:122 (-) Transcript_20786:82-447(-)